MFVKTFKPHYYSQGGKCFPSRGQLSEFIHVELEIKVEMNRSRHLLTNIASWDSSLFSNLKLHILERKDSLFGIKYSDLITLKPNLVTDIFLFKETRDCTNMHRVFEEPFCNEDPGYWRNNCVRYRGIYCPIKEPFPSLLTLTILAFLLLSCLIIFHIVFLFKLPNTIFYCEMENIYPLSGMSNRFSIFFYN